MTILSQLKIEEKDLVTRLPYRVGLWISRADEAGGDEANEAEMTALTNILHGFATEIFGSEDTQHIMADTVQNRQDWPHWGADLQNVPDECMQAVDILTLHSDPKELSAFKQRLYEIGEAVALAFCEAPAEPPKAGLITQILSVIGVKPAQGTHHLNISAKERQALVVLSAALDFKPLS